MILRILGHSFHYEMENLCRMFFPNTDIKLAYDESGSADKTVVTKLVEGDGGARITVSCNICGEVDSEVGALSADEIGKAELRMAQLMFALLCRVTGYVPAWGVLTGVRPSKLMMRLIESEGEQGARDYFMNSLLVSGEKTDLACKVAKAEEAITALSRPDSFSLYVSIPFCPSRCSYCSFVSHSITNSNAKKLLPEYLNNLCRELEITADIARDLGLRLESIYFGGGTPSVLEAAQLDRLLTVIDNRFDLSHLREYTVEAGRPDTVTAAKLGALRRHNVGRISINPQTFNQSVLDCVGRKHTAEQSVAAYMLARSFGFDSINMDLIAGLPTESVESFCSSVDTAVSLAPDNITVHTLALKRSSTLAVENHEIESGNLVKQMLSYSGKKLDENAFSPYYMYRQSKCVGNMENVGWCKQGKECLYNIFMMEECHSVLAVGAGAVTKLREPGGDFIERIFNYKYPYEYNSGFDALMQRKDRVKEFYSQY